MAGNFLTKSRHGTVYYFRRRVPIGLQNVIGRSTLVHSLQTSDRRLAIIRSRALAAQSDVLFQRIIMAKKSGKSNGFLTDYSFKIDLNEDGTPSSYSFDDVKPEDQESVNSHIRTLYASAKALDTGNTTPKHQKPFREAVIEYYEKADASPRTKATYQSKIEHAQQYFGELKNVLEIEQPDFVDYSEHVKATQEDPTTQRHYITTIATFLNWHRTNRSGLQPLTTKSLIPKKDTPDSNERDAFTLPQLRIVFENAKRYRRSNPYKFWISIAPAFLGCRIEELCQINLKTDLVRDEENKIWYLIFDAKPDPDKVKRKSMKKISSWRHAPIHSALVRHGFVDFLHAQVGAEHSRPFQKNWNARISKSTKFGESIKWSHYVTNWGGRELKSIAEQHQLDTSKIGYFHSMRHSFKSILGDAGVSSEISEALSGRRYASADAERYEKLKQNHRRLSIEGVERGLGVLADLLDDALM